MAEPEAKAEAKPKTSWFKAILGTFGGLLSGAVVMYLTPFVDKVIKPEKPVANFAYLSDGCAVRFHNLSKSGQGWWEFGDGSPLEPASPDRQFVEHTYPRPGDYTAKLTLHNRLGETNERIVTVRLEASPAPTPPKILMLEAIPVSAGSYAPATFKLVSKVENAQITVLDLGDDSLLQIATDRPGAKEQFVTFEKPGGYVVKLVAANGTQYEQKTEIITVMDAPTNSITAVLTVSDEATRMETTTRSAFFSAAFPPESREPVARFEAEVRSWRSQAITDLTFKTVEGQEMRLGNQTEMVLDPNALGMPYARNLRLQPAEDRKSVRLTGELIADPERKTPAPSLVLPVTLTVQKKNPATQTTPVTTTLNVPANGVFTSGTLMLPPIPKDWVDCQRKFRLEVRDGDKKVYEDSQLQRSVLVTLQNRKCILTTTRTNDQVRIDLMDAPTGVTSVSK